MRVRDQMFGTALPHFLTTMKFCERLQMILKVALPANARRLPGMQLLFLFIFY